MIKTLTAGHRTLFQVPDGVINLSIGAADDALLQDARSALLAASRDRFERKESTTFLQYGPTSGDPEFRTELARLITDHTPGAAANPNELMVTNGATGGLALVVSLLLEKGSPAIVEAPTYFLARDVLVELGMRLVTIPQDTGGMNLDALEEQLSDLPPSDAEFRALIYAIPTFHNPTGVSLSEARRKRMIALAYAHRALIVCDDVYEMLPFSKDVIRPPRLVSLDTGTGRVISNGSFSKILGPGVRCGWLEARPDLLTRISTSGIAKSGGSINHMTTGVLASLMAAREQDRILDSLQEIYGRRCAALCDALSTHLPKTVTISQPEGGFFVWLTLPDGVDASTLQPDALKEAKVGFQVGRRFGASPNHIRLSFSHYPEMALRKAAARLGQFLTKRM